MRSWGGRGTQGSKPFYFDFRGWPLDNFINRNKPRVSTIEDEKGLIESKLVYAEIQGMKSAKKGNWPRVVFWAKRWIKLRETK